MNELELPELKCLRCGHEWIPRKSRRPYRCSRCKSPYWDVPKKVKPTNEHAAMKDTTQQEGQ